MKRERRQELTEENVDMVNLGGCGAARCEGERLDEGLSVEAGVSDAEAAGGVEGLDVGAEGHMDDGFAACVDAVVGADESGERAETEEERRSAEGVDRPSGRETGCGGGGR